MTPERFKVTFRRTDGERVMVHVQRPGPRPCGMAYEGRDMADAQREARAFVEERSAMDRDALTRLGDA